MRRAAGSFSSRKGAQWHRQGADERKRVEGQAMAKTPAGQFGRLSPISQEATRRAIDAQTCPWCGTGPFKNIGLHTNIAHGVSASELRKLAGYSANTSICAPELSEKSRKSLESREDRIEMTLKGAAASASAGMHHKATAAWVAKTRDTNRERDQKIIDLYHAGYLFQQIADRVEIGARQVIHVLRRHGVDCDDGRSARFRNDEFRTRAMQRLQKCRDSSRTKLEALRVARIARYTELGGGWPAIERLSGEWQVSGKTVVAYLKKSDVDVPDGRASSPRRLGCRTYKRKDPVPCSDRECSQKAIKRGTCSKHYQRWRTASRAGRS